MFNFGILRLSGSEEKLRDDFGRLPFDIETATLEARGVKYFDVVQNAGEVMFIPSGWFHQVFNLVRHQESDGHYRISRQN
jgi:hypothetical protein